VAQKHSSGRELIGALVAPLSIPAIFSVIGLIPGQGVWGVLEIFISAIFSYMGMFLFGLPVIYYLKNKGALTLAWVVGIGAVVGIVVWLIFMGLLAIVLGSSSEVGIFSLIFGAVMGFIVSLTYGLISGVKVGGHAT